MIRLSRGNKIPKKLSAKGSSETDLLIKAFQANGKVAVKSSVYGHKSVKDLLIELQNKKCAFCETRLDQQFGHVEHFRPKKRWQGCRTSPAQSPGYFWLAYEWTNLLLCCEVCNTRYKRDYFPLKDESCRADPNVRDVSNEEPLLIDPYSVDPQEHLGFYGWNIFPKDNSLIGQVTIDGFGLNSDDLDECRRDRLTEVTLVLEALERGVAKSDASDRAVDFLRVAISSSGKYSAMIRENLGARIQQILSNCTGRQRSGGRS